MLVDVGYAGHYKIPTVVHRMNVITGDYLSPIRINGNYQYQIEELCSLILIDKPDKIIFDKSGYGYQLYQGFMNRIKFKEYRKYFTVDSFGLITHNGLTDGVE